eukprot:12575030-Alexandrium_andersonii.AAC.1
MLIRLRSRMLDPMEKSTAPSATSAVREITGTVAHVLGSMINEAQRIPVSSQTLLDSILVSGGDNMVRRDCVPDLDSSKELLTTLIAPLLSAGIGALADRAPRILWGASPQ